jgi:hypothetical protein
MSSLQALVVFVQVYQTQLVEYIPMTCLVDCFCEYVHQLLIVSNEWCLEFSRLHLLSNKVIINFNMLVRSWKTKLEAMCLAAWLSQYIFMAPWYSIFMSWSRCLIHVNSFCFLLFISWGCHQQMCKNLWLIFCRNYLPNLHQKNQPHH